MVIRKKELIKKFYIISFIMLTNSLLFGSFFNLIGLNFWRQIIWLIGCYIFIKSVSNIIDKKRTLKMHMYLKICVFILVISVILALLFYSFSLMRVLFSAVNYIYGFSFIGFAIYYSKQKKPLKLFTYFSFLGIFISVGLIADYFIGVSSFLGIDQTLRADSMGRATFLTENPTTLGIFFNFLFVCNIYCFYITKKLFYKYFHLLSSLLFFLGAFFTGSRQVLLILIITLILGYSFIFLKNKIKMVLVSFFFILPLYFFIVNIMNFTLNNVNDEFQERYIYDSLDKEEYRTNRWQDGLNQFQTDNMLYWIQGRGIGATTDKGIGKGEYIQGHYENSFLARFAETGFLGLYIYIFPIYYSLLLFFKSKKTIYFKLLLCALLGFIIISWISPNGAAPQSQVILFLIIGLQLYADYFDIDSKNKLINIFIKK